MPFMIKTTGIPSKLGFTSVPVIFEYPLKDTDIFQFSAHFELKITFWGIIFEPILDLATSYLLHITSSIKHQTSSVPRSAHHYSLQYLFIVCKDE